MQRIVTAQQMREIDRRTIEDVGIPSLLLMENAGLGVVNVVEKILAETCGRRVTILCGRGNNGGDGMVVARHLFNRGTQLDVYLVGQKEMLKGDALINHQILEGLGVKIHQILEKKDLRRIVVGDLIVDALLGTGITGEVTGFLAELINWMNGLSLPVVSVDLPSGLHSDDGTFEGSCVRAEHTVTMAEMKRGLALPPGRELAGKVTVVDIGAPDFVSQSVGVKTFLLEEADVASRLPERPPSAHKGIFGKILVLAGSPGMTGAAVLASRAALRVGGGLTILGIPKGLNVILEQKLTEVMTRPLPETSEGSLSLEAETEIDALLDWTDVIAIGPGLTTLPETVQLIHRVVSKSAKPMVIDADGLNAFYQHTEILEKKQGEFVLTPHYGELSRLIGLSIEEISTDPVEVARRSAARFGGVVILKGSPTVIADPVGEVFVNPTGNSGMATPGSGDVLTGMIAGLLGQGCSIHDAGICGVYIHGLAGDLGGSVVGRRSLIAGDIIRYLGEAIYQVEGGK